jgi:hypothetical protein
MQVVTFKEILKGFIQALQLPFVAPAIIINTVLFFYLIPSFFPGIVLAKGIDFYDGVYVYFTLIISYLFYANNTWLIRFFEGYHFTEYDAARKYYSKKIRKFQKVSNRERAFRKTIERNAPGRPSGKEKIRNIFSSE